MPNIRLPATSDRTTIVGSTGAGKTVFGVFLLSTRNYAQRPVYIFDWKREPLLGQLPAKPLDLRQKPPARPGLYIARPLPGKDEQSIAEEFFWKVYSKEDAIVYIDEGTMVSPNNHGFRALLTQGRSKNIEVITLSQRPVKLMKEVFSEATFFSVFRLTNLRDRLTVSEWIARDVYSPRMRLPEHHSVWYDVARDQGATLLPAPPPAEIIAGFHAPSARRRVI